MVISSTLLYWFDEQNLLPDREQDFNDINDAMHM